MPSVSVDTDAATDGSQPITQDAGPPDGGDGSSETGDADAGSPGSFRILFDAAHRNSVGNADWVVDRGGSEPTPAHPSRESEWSGGISAWAFELHTSGRYEVRQLVTGQSLSFGEAGAQDLAGYDVFISVEPEIPFSADERAALHQFVQAGGGLFLVADHAGAQRCTSCIEAWRVINVALTAGPMDDMFGARCDGNTIGQDGLTGTATPDGVASGPFGVGSRLGFHSGTAVSVTGSNSSAIAVVRSRRGDMMIASSTASGGRLVLLGDSSPADDGTCTGCRATLYDGWGEADDATLLLNATAWLAHDDR